MHLHHEAPDPLRLEDTQHLHHGQIVWLLAELDVGAVTAGVAGVLSPGVIFWLPAIKLLTKVSRSRNSSSIILYRLRSEDLLSGCAGDDDLLFYSNGNAEKINSAAHLQIPLTCNESVETGDNQPVKIKQSAELTENV